MPALHMCATVVVQQYLIAMCDEMMMHDVIA